MNKCQDAYEQVDEVYRPLTSVEYYPPSPITSYPSKGYLPHPLVNKTKEERQKEFLNKLYALLKEYNDI
jgi:hypothetical protein